ncbi:Entner-Doudoroff aldolase [Rheinheimera sp. A13L]|uniref:bifunctional 4-hydroxy-2-oxoglutarate aldolase/2-dehydro-3-deoxy-phosphogluconate aldolase n=1 Tax=Rheinheimera sp. A13L TaxID=506534 RepID=UPI0002125389|nr:bifunctional 4-hydroxy-2-oxoglutarate aldolase/2-dehydro-3-deoxy-phosphogluconate aldolase [Rheinheimera sp. A13L]EGM79530.1 Entner-Doudoroff aldolase [Rheinheimera sp. A13L]
MTSLSSLLKGGLLLPIIQAEQPAQAVAIAKAMQQGGVTAVEVVLRTAAALDCISAIRAEVPELLTGAGTILSAKDANNAKAAGAQFLVSPASTPDLLKAMMNTELALAPGVATPSEMAMALELGLTELKFFPAHLAGGIEMLKALAGIFQQVKFCPTGGVQLNNLAEFLALPNVFVAGGSWLSPKDLVQQQNWAAITELTRQSVTVAEQSRVRHSRVA